MASGDWILKKTVKFLKWFPRRDSNTDNFVCQVKFSLIDSELLNTPRERESFHTITITITDILLSRWHIPGGLDFGITDEMIKIALQFLEDHITQKLKQSTSLENEPESVTLNTKNAPEECPYKLSNIHYPNKTSFEVEIEDKALQKNSTTQVNIGGNVSGSTIIIGNDNKVQHTVAINSQPDYQKIERLMPSLLKEMSNDLLNNPTTREFVILMRSWVYNHRGHYLAYYLDEHEDLEGKLQVLENLGFIREITYNNVKRFIFLEKFVDYLVTNKYSNE